MPLLCDDAGGLKPAELTIVYVLRPGAARHLEAAAVSTSRNRGPPLTSVAVPGFARLCRDAVGERPSAFVAFASLREDAPTRPLNGEAGPGRGANPPGLVTIVRSTAPASERPAE
jgi:hypothetical protein